MPKFGINPKCSIYHGIFVYSNIHKKYWHMHGVSELPLQLYSIKINFVYFQFSVSQFTWQFRQTNNSIKPNRNMKCRCCAWVQKRFCCHRGSNSWPRAWHSEPMFRAKCDTTQLFRFSHTTLFLSHILFFETA